eukprot:NODE_39_length_35218_cov_0.479655.p22 type:complete len:237 gc:universal NODE_39_length_35218_cov_0.479655:2729-3439(+)
MSVVANKLLKNIKLHKGTNGFELLANEKQLKINNMPIVIPLKAKSFAECLFYEWKLLKEFKPSKLPLSQLYSRGMDLKDKEAKNKCIDQLLQFYKNDAICFHAETPSNLSQMQNERYIPLLNTMRKKFNLDINTTNSFYIEVSTNDLKILRDLLNSYDNHKLNALERSALTAKSFLIGLALCNKIIDAEEAANLARLETLAQIEWFGEVEDSHDVDEHYMKREMYGTQLYVENFIE